MRHSLEDLSNLTDALYQVELSEMRTLNAREAGLRRDLAELDALRRCNATLPPDELHSVRQIGADVLWEGWINRTRVDLNTQLARILAQKAQRTVKLRRAFGKQIAAQEMLNQERKNAEKNREKRNWQVHDDIQLMKAHRSQD